MTKFRSIKIGSPRTEEGMYFVHEFEDFEYVNPNEYYKKATIALCLLHDQEILKLNGINVDNEFIKQDLWSRANDYWEKRYKEFQSIELPVNLLALLNAESKKQQIKLLKGLSLTTYDLVAFILTAYKKYGYTFSQYKATHLPKGTDKTKMPYLVHVDENNKVNTLGETSFSEGQQKQIVEHQNVIVSKFLDNGDKWICFFFTYRSRLGKEKHSQGRPHLHFISSAWNIPRQDVKEQLSSKNYSLPSLPHIDFIKVRTTNYDNPNSG